MKDEILEKNTAEILEKYARGDFQLGFFECAIDGYTNIGYIKGGIPKRLYIDISKKNEKCCFTYAHFSGYCPACIKEYEERRKREKKQI
jgi:hypothetical protein